MRPGSKRWGLGEGGLTVSRRHWTILSFTVGRRRSDIRGGAGRGWPAPGLHGAIDLGDGQRIEIEVRSGGASLSAAQRRFDSWIQDGNAADGVGLSSNNKVVGVYYVTTG
jgi:hypothetical protein